MSWFHNNSPECLTFNGGFCVKTDLNGGFCAKADDDDALDDKKH